MRIQSRDSERPASGQVSEASAVEWAHQMLSATTLHDIYTVSKIFELMGVVRGSLFKRLKHMSRFP